MPYLANWRAWNSMSPRPHHKIHNVRFLSLTPASVSCLAYSPEAALLAVSRADNSIEVWNVAASPFLQVEYLSVSPRMARLLKWKVFSVKICITQLNVHITAAMVPRKFRVLGGVPLLGAGSPAVQRWPPRPRPRARPRRPRHEAPIRSHLGSRVVHAVPPGQEQGWCLCHSDHILFLNNGNRHKL